MFESKKKSLKEKLSDTATQVNKKTGDDFEKVSGELQSDIQQLAVNFNEKLQELDVINAEKKNAKIRYQRALDEGDEQGMSLCLSEIRDRNLRAEESQAELAKFPGMVKGFYTRQTKIFAIARDGQSKAEANLRAAEKELKLTEGKVKRCHALQGLINNVNTDIEDLVRTHKKEKKAFEATLESPRSNENGFWIEANDPFGGGVLRFYRNLKAPIDEPGLRKKFEASEELKSEFSDFKSCLAFERKKVLESKGFGGLSLPLMLNFKDEEKAQVDEKMLKATFEKSETLPAEFPDLKSYLDFKSRVVTQILEIYIVRAAGAGDRRREFAAKVGLKKCMQVT